MAGKAIFDSDVENNSDSDMRTVEEVVSCHDRLVRGRVAGSTKTVAFSRLFRVWGTILIFFYCIFVYACQSRRYVLYRSSA